MSDHITEHLVEKSSLLKTLKVIVGRGINNLKILAVNLKYLQSFTLYRDKVEVIEFKN
jgi:hypothetical protein